MLLMSLSRIKYEPPKIHMNIDRQQNNYWVILMVNVCFIQVINDINPLLL